MIRRDSCTIVRISTTMQAGTNKVIKNPVTYGPYKCHLGRSRGTVVQNNPENSFSQTMRLYMDISCNITEGDIAVVNGTKYVVDNIYKPSNHHIEADVHIKKEV